MTTKLEDLVESFAGEAFVPTHACPICGGRSVARHAAYNTHPQKPFKFDYRVCKRCDHGWIDPMPTQGLLSHLYGSGSGSVVGEWGSGVSQPLSLPERLVCSRELSNTAPDRGYFELGVGRARLYTAFLEAGWRCSGVEPGDWGRNLPGVRPDIASVPRSFVADVIVANDVLEHVADPVATILKLREFATAGTRIYCSMPNRQSLRALFGRENWRMLRPLGHVHFWSKKSLLAAFRQSDFSIAEMIKTDLWEPRGVRSVRHLFAACVERMGVGDQWMLVACAV
jgi:hypothetical protein